MTVIKKDYLAPTATLQTLDGDEINLAETWADQPAWLIFLRHLA